MAFVVGASLYPASFTKLYVVMFERLGFEEIACRAIRKRNSRKELFEFDVSAKWTGGRQ